MIKARPCAVCQSIWHTKGHHKPSKPWKRASRPMRRESAKSRTQRLYVRQAWFSKHPGPTWNCYISKHPLCPKVLTEETLVLEHDLSKARSPKDKFNVGNIYPSCTFDNAAKGSLSAEEYLNKE